ncbi:class II glutamine amidotransferase [Caldivirga sp. UBA161]|uniref:class II glutamine amidotransferase n=1 Tax=Caldivirga sp. UBA161 TaxID=1915569 RepID=UPI0025B94874|nr:hypothetical protein [Caldivirga sp. UBA161]
MCRFVALTVSGPELVKESLLKLKDAAKVDPMGPSGVINHSDGWGLAVMQGNPRNGTLTLYKATKPIYNDPSFNTILESITQLNNVVYSGVAHVLNADDKNVVNAITVHPTNAQVNDGELYIVHNGVVDKLKVYEYLRSKYGIKLNVESMNDTYVLAQLLARIYDDVGDLMHSLSRLAGLIRDGNWLKSALNTGILLVKPSEVKVYVTLMYSPSVLNNERRRKYYNLFMIKSNKGTLMASSTLIRAYGLGNDTAEEVEPRGNELIQCVLSPSSINCEEA